VTQALHVRSDVRVAQATLDNARDNAGLAQANRWVNPTLAVGLTAIPATSAGVDAKAMSSMRTTARACCRSR
jgi:cobalt-zinc-cadmium efflux system outer membrane protein